MSNIVFGIICGILEFIVFLFLVVSIPSDILRNKDKRSWSFVDEQRQCFSFWGTKRCGPHKHNPLKAPLKGFPTKRIRNTVNAAAAFDIVGMVTSLVCFITCLMMACKCCGAVVPVIFAVLTVVFVIITVGCLLGVWYTKLDLVIGGKIRLTKVYNLGFGTVLVVAGWCLQVVVLILLIIAACCCSSSGGDDGKKEEANEPVESDDAEL